MNFHSRLATPGGRPFLTDAGLETDLIFNEGIDLPEFSAVTLLRTTEGRAALERYYERYVAIARSAGFGLVLESPTWRSSADWAPRLGYSPDELRTANAEAIALMLEIRDRHSSLELPMLVSGCVGPRGDGYVAGELMSPEEAEAYHREQIAVMVQAGAQVVSAITMTNVAEAVGIARAAAKLGVPVVISFTVETDGRLPTGQSLEEAITQTDLATDSAPAYFMINCAHPTHFDGVLASGGEWTRRIGGIRANASRCSHAELNEAAELDRGDPQDLALRYRELSDRLPSLRVFGGCCGTDHTHVAAIAEALAPESALTGAA